jgi:hypothetical protein
MTDEAKFKAYSHILDGLVEGAVAEQENAQKLWESYKKAAEAYGFDISQKGSGSDGLSKGVQSITESQADLLSSYVNGMRADLSVIRSIMEKGGYSIGAAVEMIDYTSQISEANTQLFALVTQGSEMSLIAQSQLNSLNQIVSNTSRNAIAAEKISVASANIEGLLNRVIDKGSNKLKV